MGRLIANPSLPSATWSLLSLWIFRFDTAPDRLSPLPSFDLGVPTVFTEGFEIFAESSLGGIGGFEEECRRWCDGEEKEAVIDDVEGRDMDCGEG